MGEFYLAHIGISKLNGAKIGSGRYPLGSGKRPYQNMGSGEVATARKRGLFGRNRKKGTVLTELPEETKRQIIATGNVKAAYVYRRFLSNDEIDAVINRYTKEKNLADLLPKKKKGKDYVNTANDVLDMGYKLIKNGTNVWNATARIYNVKNPDHPMTIIPTLEELKKKATGS